MKPTQFADIYKKPGKRHVFCFRSGMTVYEEGFDVRMLIPLGWNGAGFPLDILDDFPTYLKSDAFPHTEIFSVDANGVSLTASWQLQSFETQSEGETVHASLKLVSGRAPLSVTVHTMADGTAVFTRWLEFENTGDAPLNLSNVTIMGGGMESFAGWREYISEEELPGLYSVGYFEHAPWGHEGAFRWHDLGTAQMTVCGHYKRDRHRHPMFMLKNNAAGTIWFAQLGFTGGWAFDFDANSDTRDGRVHLSFAARLDGERPTWVLAPGETVQTPKLHIGMMNGDLDDIVNEMHAHARKSVFIRKEAAGTDADGAYGGLIEAGMGPERLMDVAYTKHYIDTAAEVGAEAFIIDAGWHCPVGTECKEWKHRCGDWEYDPARYPNGMAEVRDYAHSKGLLFGLWAAIEQAGNLSKAAAEHPDWLIRDTNGAGTILLDLTKPEVAAHVEACFDHLVRDYGIELFRIDSNITPFRVHYTDARGEDGNARYYAAFYAMLDRLRTRYPDIVFENCAGGGARTDFGIMEHFTHTWVTDWQIAPRAEAIMNGMTMVLPPERVDFLASGMNSHKMGTLDLIVRRTLFGRPTTNDYNTIGSKMNPNQIAFVRHCYDIYREVIRPFAPTGKIYHHTPEAWQVQPRGTMVLERAAADASAGVVGIFRLCGANADETVVYPRGIDMGAQYDVTFDNSDAVVRMRGFDMAQSGLRVRIGQNLASELIVYRRVPEKE